MDSYLSKDVPGGWLDLWSESGEPVERLMPASSFYHIFLALSEYLRYRGVVPDLMRKRGSS